MATIKVLQEELMLKIFSYYIRSEGNMEFSRNIPLVCKYWNELSSDSSLWRDVRTDNWNFLHNVSRRGLLEHTQSLEFISDEDYSAKNLAPVLRNIKDLKDLDLRCKAVGGDAVKLVAQYCPHLKYFHLRISKPTMSRDQWNQFLTVCGMTLKSLHLKYFGSQKGGRERLLSKIASKCPLLEKLSFFYSDYYCKAPFPIHKLRSGCPRLKELEFEKCHLISSESDDSLGCGFEDLKKFSASSSDFNDFDVYTILKDSKDLEHLELSYNINLVFGDILQIPSNNVRFLKIKMKDPENNLEALGDAVKKWRCTLSFLDYRFWRCDMSGVLENFLCDNLNPQLETLIISDCTNPHFLKKFIEKCTNLIHLEITGEKFKGREEMIERAFEYLMETGFWRKALNNLEQ